MPEGRPSISASLDRKIREEAGHRCAIPTCRSTAALELAHIVPWSQVREHSFDNLILLCANDHFRYDNGEISRISIRNYKANLSVINGRYSETERRILEWFVDNPAEDGYLIEGSSLLDLTMRNLVRDGLVKVTETMGFRLVTHLTATDNRDLGKAYQRLPVVYELTDKGSAFTARWIGADPLE